MNRLLLPVVLMFSALASFSQDNSLGKSDPSAKKILDEVSNRFKGYKTIEAHFTLKIENSTGKTVGTKSGTVSMKDSKYRISVAGQEIYSDGTNIWTFDPAANEVQITKFDPSTNTITPQKMFTNFYDKDFLYKLNDDTKVGTKIVQEIELTPVDKTKPFFKVLIDVDKKTKSILYSKIFQKNGDRYTYTITSMKPNPNLADGLFIFDTKAYPKVEVIDLR